LGSSQGLGAAVFLTVLKSSANRQNFSIFLIRLGIWVIFSWQSKSSSYLLYIRQYDLTSGRNMRLIDLFRENEITLTPKGNEAMIKVVKEIYPHLASVASDSMLGKVIVYDLPNEDCLKILQMTARYAGLLRER
jgi:hypothetical protein